MLTRRTLIAAGGETTYGSVGTTGQILAYDVDLDVVGEVLERPIVRDTLTPMPHVIGMKEMAVTFKTEIRGYAAGSVPEMDGLLQGCGFATAAHSDTAEIVYSVVSLEDDIKSTSIYIYKDGTRHAMLGCRGTVKFIFEAGKYGVAEWDFKGIYQNTGVTMTTPDLSGVDNTKPPIIYNSAFNIGGFNPVCSKCEIDLGNEVTRRDDLTATTGVKSFNITARKPKMTFRADAVVESSNPFWGDWEGHIVDSYGIQAGSAPVGQQVTFSGYFQYEKPKYADDSGQVVYDCEASLCSSDVNTNDDEITITFGESV